MRVYPEFTVDGEFERLGADGFSGSLNDRQFSFLRSLGFTGSLSDMIAEYSKEFFPARLFSSGAQGLFLDPSVLSSLSQDTVGTTPVTGPGQSVGRALDFSGRGNHATQAAAAQRPTYQVDGAGRPYLYFDGVDDWLDTLNFDWGSGEATLIVVAASDVNTGIGATARYGTSWLNGGFWHDLPFETNNYRAASGGGTNSSIFHSASPMTVAVRSSRSRLQPASIDFHVNGTLIGADTTTQGASVAYPLSNMRIGSWYGTNHFNGNIYGVLAINRRLSDTELKLVERYFADRIGVTLA